MSLAPTERRPPVQPACYDARDLEILLGVSARTIRRLGSTGSIPGRLRIGDSLRWSRKVVDQWIANGCGGLRDRGALAAQGEGPGLADSGHVHRNSTPP